MVTARLHPSRCRANICTRPAVRVEKDGRLDFEHTLTHINTHRHPRQLFVLTRSPISLYFEN